MQRYSLKNIMEKDSTGVLVKSEDAEKLEDKLKEVTSILSDSLLSEKQKIYNALELLAPT